MCIWSKSTLYSSCVLADTLEITAVLERHLNLRPIWIQVCLHQQMLEVPQADLELQLQKLCYQFKEGADLLYSAETYAAALCSCAGISDAAITA